ncbi:MAG TPA: DUF86 domain-containing protein [Dehalococcoidia bacterium]|nr:DUF86 domain-containing protein [Dehalococcoidia bacterium]
MSRDFRLYLEDMRDCCQKVLRYSAGMTAEQLAADDRTFDAIMRNLEITGEAVRNVSNEVRERYPEVEWRSIAGFRDVAIHSYPTIDEEIVWDIVSRKVPELLRQVEHILAIEFPAD